ncbi:hypothetical protein NQZ68_003623 [Dissostichus eleginoides]|nr:hypothetical protein NQZ68_003623 [Dissostichus eleginoides]
MEQQRAMPSSTTQTLHTNKPSTHTPEIRTNRIQTWWMDTIVPCWQGSGLKARHHTDRTTGNKPAGTLCSVCSLSRNQD